MEWLMWYINIYHTVSVWPYHHEGCVQLQYTCWRCVTIYHFSSDVIWSWFVKFIIPSLAKLSVICGYLHQIWQRNMLFTGPGVKVTRTIFLVQHPIQNFTKICPVADKFIHADGRTDSNDEANSSFLQFCERTMKEFHKGCHKFCVTNTVHILTFNISTNKCTW